MLAGLYHQTEVEMNRDHVMRRRDFLRGITSAGVAAGTLSWADMMSLQAANLRRRDMACIVLWMQGGPSQFETFSPKPNDAAGGETKAIPTSVPGIQIAENLPETAGVMDDVCLIRSVNSKEGSHPRASFLMHTGYVPTASVKHPELGAVVSERLGDSAMDLPGFVRVGNRQRGAAGGGLLGVDFDPFVIANATRAPENTTVTTGEQRYRRRLQLLDKIEEHYANHGGPREVAEHRAQYDKASRMVLSAQMSAFDIAREPKQVRTSYGDSEFGAGCLLARRLVESGVTFVEVSAGNWDTHYDNFSRSRELCQQVDRPYAALLRDLKGRGLLDKTLVVWMGEFGRTPRINARGGRDHFPRAFDVALAGAGVRGGQVIGATDSSGAEVVERPVRVTDLFRTFCHSLNIDADHEFMSSVGRPIKIVEGGETVGEVFA